MEGGVEVVGAFVGDLEGVADGDGDGNLVVGATEGLLLWATVGRAVARSVGFGLGTPLGCNVGISVGEDVGVTVGLGGRRGVAGTTVVGAMVRSSSSTELRATTFSSIPSATSRLNFMSKLRTNSSSQAARPGESGKQ